METRENILKELKEIAPMLAKMEKRNFYSAPENYFLNFKSEILEQVKLSGVKQELKIVAPELLKIEKMMSAEVPAGYFNLFADDLMKRIRANEVAAELKEIAPTLTKAEKINLLKVPENYFNAFPQQIMKRIEAEQKANAVATKPNWIGALNNVLENISAVIFKPKYSFAFSGMASVLIIAVMMFNEVEQQCSDIDCKMAKLSEEELNAYLDKGTDVYQEEIFEADFADKQSSEQTIKHVLNDVSDEELNNAILD